MSTYPQARTGGGNTKITTMPGHALAGLPRSPKPSSREFRYAKLPYIYSWLEFGRSGQSDAMILYDRLGGAISQVGANEVLIGPRPNADPSYAVVSEGGSWGPEITLPDQDDYPGFTLIQTVHPTDLVVARGLMGSINAVVEQRFSWAVNTNGSLIINNGVLTSGSDIGNGMSGNTGVVAGGLSPCIIWFSCDYATRHVTYGKNNNTPLLLSRNYLYNLPFNGNRHRVYSGFGPRSAPFYPYKGNAHEMVIAAAPLGEAAYASDLEAILAEMRMNLDI